MDFFRANNVLFIELTGGEASITLKSFGTQHMNTLYSFLQVCAVSLRAKSKGDKQVTTNARDQSKLKQCTPNHEKLYTFSSVESTSSQTQITYESSIKTFHTLQLSKKYFPFHLSQRGIRISNTKQTKTVAITTGKISICPRHCMVHSWKEWIILKI